MYDFKKGKQDAIIFAPLLGLLACVGSGSTAHLIKLAIGSTKTGLTVSIHACGRYKLQCLLDFTI